MLQPFEIRGRRFDTLQEAKNWASIHVETREAIMHHQENGLKPYVIYWTIPDPQNPLAHADNSVTLADFRRNNY